jgi:hypothetical protein
MTGILIVVSWDLTLFILVGGYRHFIQYESPTVRVEESDASLKTSVLNWHKILQP